MNRVVSYGALTGDRRPSLDVVKGLLRELLHEEATPAITIEAIQKKIAEHFDILPAEITSKRRPEHIAFPRQIAMYLSRQLTESSLNPIGEVFGGRDCSTVLLACRLVKERMKLDPNIRQVVGYLERNLCEEFITPGWFHLGGFSRMRCTRAAEYATLCQLEGMVTP